MPVNSRVNSRPSATCMRHFVILADHHAANAGCMNDIGPNSTQFAFNRPSTDIVASMRAQSRGGVIRPGQVGRFLLGLCHSPSTPAASFRRWARDG